MPNVYFTSLFYYSGYVFFIIQFSLICAHAVNAMHQHDIMVLLILLNERCCIELSTLLQNHSIPFFCDDDFYLF